MVFFKGFAKKMGGLCVIGFVSGMFFAFIMPPVVIAITEGIMLAFLCVYLFCS